MRNTEDEDKKEKEKRYGIIIFGVLVLAFLGLAFAGYSNFLADNRKYGFSDIGAIGDSFGVITCVASLITVVLVYLAWKTQREELRETRNELSEANKAYKVANKARDEANEAYREQLRNNERNNFFSEFKELVNPLNKIHNEPNTNIIILRNIHDFNLIEECLESDEVFKNSLYRLYALLLMLRESRIVFGGVLSDDDLTKLYTYMNLQMNYSNYKLLNEICNAGYFKHGGYADEKGVKFAIDDWLTHNFTNEEFSKITDKT